ncbi:hypothetical protein EIKCOROL_02103 [Eikenella corrodens ATCC 23834]|uniref:Uncharacterized protein n=1 Tax=Eikenella corrodens ATCC 23834 TaxID=546274 RepID=C0DXJ2_EIKCO|nr:hypothetical protein EIKCOROL_02103 [Eikenella corrodens ATCC 23834]
MQRFSGSLKPFYSRILQAEQPYIHCCKTGQFAGNPLYRLPENHLHKQLGKFQVA